MKIFLRLCSLFVFFFLFAPFVFGQALLPSKSASKEEMTILERGMELHDKGKYDEAIAEYQAVLAKNPSCESAIYETANSYYAKGDTAKSREFAMKGIQFDSPDFGRFCIMLGSIEDDASHYENAIEYYKKAIEADPNYHYAYFNLGISLARKGKVEEALENFKHSAQLEPNHFSSHLRIGKIYESKQMRIPAIMAYTRCLLSGYDERRSPDVFKYVKKLVNNSVERTAGGGTHIIISAGALDSTEGNFSAADLGSSIMGTIDIDKAIDSTRPSASSFERQINMLDKIFQGISLCYRPESKGFAMHYYGKYFSDLYKAGYSKVLCYFLAKYEDTDASLKWLDDHQKEVEAFGVWHANYYKKK
jgi:tetratricopeptide (TPR) repeat protein